MDVANVLEAELVGRLPVEPGEVGNGAEAVVKPMSQRLSCATCEEWLC